MSLTASSESSYLRHERREMISFVPSDAKRILDVGCAEGRFGQLLMMERPSVEVWGIEPRATAFAMARKSLHTVVHGEFGHVSGIPDDYFDVVIFNDSLEHFADHLIGLRAAHRALKFDGKVVASIPNVRYWPHVQRYLLDGDWKYEDSGILDRTHLRFFTKRSIPREMARGGFRTLSVVGINPGWIGLKFRLLRSLFRRRFEDMEFAQFAVIAEKLSPPNA